MDKVTKSALLMVIMIISAPVWAQPGKFEVSGFMTTRFSQTDEPAYYLANRGDSGINQDGSFLGTRLGINLSATLADDVIIASQFISTIEDSTYAARMDWAFLSYSLRDDVRLRVGKLKFPVGLVNEYIDVGVAYPWIQPPETIYAEYAAGPNATREAYTGASLLWGWHDKAWDYGLDLFAGQVDLMEMTVKGLAGATLRADWDDVVSGQVSYYRGEMNPRDLNGPMAQEMNGNPHAVTIAGVKVDWHNIIGYTERAHVHMFSMNGAMDSDAWYATLGYRSGQWLPHLTYQDWHQRSGYGQHSVGIGLNYMLSESIVIKLGVSRIRSRRITPLADWLALTPPVTSVGLFDAALSDDVTRLVDVAIETVF